jgi:hypothetical protein
MTTFEELISQPNASIVAYHPRSTDENYSVKIGVPGNGTKFFPNVKADRLKQLLGGNFHPEGFSSEGHESMELDNPEPQQQELQKQEQEPEHHGKTRGRPYSGKSFLEFMNEGGKITEYHPTKIGYYSVHVVHPSGIEDTFSNISPEHFEKYKNNGSVNKYPEEWSIHPHRVGDTFEKVMQAGGQILDKKEFPSSSVRILMPADKGGGMEFFSNISPERLEKYKSQIDLSKKPASKEEASYHHRKGNIFEKCMEQGGTIVSIEEYPFYSVHVRAADGNLEFFSHVGAANIERFEKRAR